MATRKTKALNTDVLVEMAGNFMVDSLKAQTDLAVLRREMQTMRGHRKHDAQRERVNRCIDRLEVGKTLCLACKGRLILFTRIDKLNVKRDEREYSDEQP